MPKNRKRANRPGAKSTSIRTKFKIGGRKSGKGADQISSVELRQMLEKVAKRDHSLILQILAKREKAAV